MRAFTRQRVSPQHLYAAANLGAAPEMHAQDVQRAYSDRASRGVPSLSQKQQQSRQGVENIENRRGVQTWKSQPRRSM